MAESLTYSFRPQNRVVQEFVELQQWCDDQRISISAVFNAFIPAIAYAMRNQLIQGDDGKEYIRADFGDVEFIRQAPRGFFHKGAPGRVKWASKLERHWQNAGKPKYVRPSQRKKDAGI